MLHSVSQTNKLLFDYVYKGDAMKNNILMLTRVLTLAIAALLVGSVWGFTTNQDSEINAGLTVTGALKIGSVAEITPGTSSTPSNDGIVTSTETIASNANREDTIPTTKAVKAYVDSVNPIIIAEDFSRVARAKQAGNLAWTLRVGGSNLVTDEQPAGDYFVVYDLGMVYSGWELIVAKNDCGNDNISDRLGSVITDGSGKGDLAFSLTASSEVAFCAYDASGVDSDVTYDGIFLLIRHKLD